MLLVPVYHALQDRSENGLKKMKEHFLWLKENTHIVLPGETLSLIKPSVCLTFDDATCDFYFHIFPLLKELDMKALLGVPTQFIEKTQTQDPETRLQAISPLSPKFSPPPSYAFCSFDELKEMSKAGIKIASHSHSHPVLTSLGLESIEREVSVSKEILEKELDQSIDTFIYPYGKFNYKVHRSTACHYRYIMRLGGGINTDWQEGPRLIYRIVSNLLEPASRLCAPLALLKGWSRLIVNRMRRR